MHYVFGYLDMDLPEIQEWLKSNCRPDFTMQFLDVSTPEIKGCVDIRVEDPADLHDALVTAVAVDGSVVVEVISAIEMPTAAGGPSSES